MSGQIHDNVTKKFNSTSNENILQNLKIYWRIRLSKSNKYVPLELVINFADKVLLNLIQRSVALYTYYSSRTISPNCLGPQMQILQQNWQKEEQFQELWNSSTICDTMSHNSRNRVPQLRSSYSMIRQVAPKILLFHKMWKQSNNCGTAHQELEWGPWFTKYGKIPNTLTNI